MNEKVKAHHLERGAYVYVRQSTPYQVRNNLESKERQYALEGRAQQLGFSKVVVIDEDLGRSGSGLQERPGFGRCLLWKLLDWHATIAIGITWLISAH
jgi:resolvase-like protein